MTTTTTTSPSRPTRFGISGAGRTDIAVPQLTHDSSRSLDSGAGSKRGGVPREGLHEGVRRGLCEGVRPASDPALGVITPGHGGGGGSAAWADLRG